MIEKAFREGMKYSGEIFYDGYCNVDANCVTALKRNGQSITCRENFGKADGDVKEAFIQTIYGLVGIGDNWR